MSGGPGKIRGVPRVRTSSRAYVRTSKATTVPPDALASTYTAKDVRTHARKNIRTLGADPLALRALDPGIYIDTLPPIRTARSAAWLHRHRLAQAIALLPAAAAATAEFPDVAQYFTQLHRRLAQQRRSGIRLRLDVTGYGLSSGDVGIQWCATVQVRTASDASQITYQLTTRTAHGVASTCLTPGDLLFLWWQATRDGTAREATLRDTDLGTPSFDDVGTDVLRRLHGLGATARLGQGETAADRETAMQDLAARRVPDGFAALWQRAGYDAAARRALTRAVTRHGVRCNVHTLAPELAAEFPPTTVVCRSVLGPVPSRQNYVVHWDVHPALGDSLSRTELALLTAQALQLHTVGLQRRAPDGWVEDRVDLAAETDLLPPQLVRIDANDVVATTGDWPAEWLAQLSRDWRWFAALWREMQHPEVVRHQHEVTVAAKHFGPILRALPTSATRNRIGWQYLQPLLTHPTPTLTLHRVHPSAHARSRGQRRTIADRDLETATPDGRAVHWYLPHAIDPATWGSFEFLGFFPDPGSRPSASAREITAGQRAWFRLFSDDAHAPRRPLAAPGAKLRLDLDGAAARTMSAPLLAGLQMLQAQIVAREPAKLAYHTRWLATHPQIRIESAPSTPQGARITAFPAEGRLLVLVESNEPPPANAWSLLFAAATYLAEWEDRFPIRVWCQGNDVQLDRNSGIAADAFAWWQGLMNDGRARRAAVSRGRSTDGSLCPAWSLLTREERQAYEKALLWFAQHAAVIPTGLWPHPADSVGVMDDKFETFLKQYHAAVARGQQPPFPYPETLAHFKLIRDTHRRGGRA